MPERLNVNILTSFDENVSFDKTSTPLIVEAFNSRGHAVQAFSAEAPPAAGELLDCDVFVDRSPIIDTKFFYDLARGYFERQSARPVLVDNPFATMASFDKRRTHDLLSEFVPESYNLDGTNNQAAISHFADDEYVVIKNPFGWYGKGTERLSPTEALETYGAASGLVAQKFIPFEKGVGRLITLNSGGDFEVAASYVVVPDEWITSEGVHVDRELVECVDDLYEFARTVSKRSGLYLNGIDYIQHDGKYVLLEVNAVPNIHVPLESLGIDIPAQFVQHVERSVSRSSY